VSRLSIVLTALALWLFAASTAAAARSEFFGVVQGPGLDAAQDLQGLTDAKVRTARFLLLWREVQPSKGSFDWARNDLVVGRFASHGIRPVPFAYGSPAWVNTFIARPPVDSAAHEQAWRDFLDAAVARYGPGGSYWANGYHQQFPGATPLPIQSWQVWSEPSFQNFDPGGTVAHAAQKYARLLKVSHDAIKAKDSNAKIVLAGNPCCGTWTASSFLKNLYQVPGARDDFDVAAVHPYGRNVDDVRSQLVQFRAVMTDNADGSTPLWLDEFAWGSGPPDSSGHNVGIMGQQQLLDSTFKLILNNRSNWNVQRVFWFFWRDPQAGSSFAHVCPICGTAGLLRYDRTPKPAYNTFTGFTAETTPPVASITAGPSQGGFTNDPTPTFKFASNEPGSTFVCRFDANSFKLCSSPFTRVSPLPNGAHTFSVKAIDAPGNPSAVVSRSFTVDTIAPQTTITSGPSGLPTNRTPTFTFTSSEPNSTFQCRFDSQAFAACSGPGASHTPSTPLSAGSHSFQVRATDRAKNTDPTPASRTFNVL
jgi:Glycosyl hydrolase catalytic core